MSHVVFALVLAAVQSADTSYLYRIELIQAAPGRLLEVVDLYRQRSAIHVSGGEPDPTIMRHRQGDHWDLLVLTPMQDFVTYFGSARQERLRAAGASHGLTYPQWLARVTPLIAWREDVYLRGPPPTVVTEALEAGDLYHIEMFVALPGHRAELVQEREMENHFLAGLDRPTNLIFVRAGGAAWDAVTIGTYRDLPHFAASDTIPDARQTTAARAAGFAGADRIGTYLRTLIARHHDTLAGAVR